MYDIILQNNASKEFTLLQGLTNVSLTDLYLQFDEVELDVPDGEYTYACFVNDREDVEYDLKTPILDTIVIADGKHIELRDLQPLTGLLRVGTVGEENDYDTDSVTYHPYDDGRNDNNTIYYEG